MKLRGSDPHGFSKIKKGSEAAPYSGGSSEALIFFLYSVSRMFSAYSILFGELSEGRKGSLYHICRDAVGKSHISRITEIIGRNEQKMIFICRGVSKLSCIGYGALDHQVKRTVGINRVIADFRERIIKRFAVLFVNTIYKFCSKIIIFSRKIKISVFKFFSFIYFGFRFLG